MSILPLNISQPASSLVIQLWLPLMERLQMKTLGLLQIKLLTQLLVMMTKRQRIQLINSTHQASDHP